jgi:hypothetical protein
MAFPVLRRTEGSPRGIRIGDPAVSAGGRAGGGRGRVVLVGVMEEVSDATASAFRDLTGAFGGAYTEVLAAFTKVFAGTDRMQGYEVPGTLRRVARGSARAFAEVASPAANVATSTASLRSRSCLRLGCLRWRGR